MLKIKAHNLLQRLSFLFDSKTALFRNVLYINRYSFDFMAPLLFAARATISKTERVESESKPTVGAKMHTLILKLVTINSEVLKVKSLWQSRY
jgi:hypothetical protein